MISSHMSPMYAFFAFLALVVFVRADIYLNNPRGSNNKLNEPQNNVRNNRRLFDSQNNGNGGYQVGDACQPVCSNANNQYNASAPGAGEGVMHFYAGSLLTLEWTVQHACGPDDMGPKSRCEVVLQYMCNDPEQDARQDPLGSVSIRDGSTTNTIPYNQDPEAALEVAADAQYGQHEPYTYYKKCITRDRNNGLFHADQNVRNDKGAAATRQNSNGNRYGYECPEERDYYPYWHPTPWRDAVVITSDTARCSYYQQESENVKGRGECSDFKYNQAESCAASGATWSTAPPHRLPAPQCVQAQWVRDNHHGNGLDGYTHNYNWTLPALPEGVDQLTCVARMRYNISTAEYVGWGVNAVDSRYNDDRSPVRNNPEKDFVKGGEGRTGPLRLAINTAQTGRTFEDRTHKFKVVRRPAEVADSTVIHNLNVRGRRGNIVQVYPSVEYDFVPNVLVVRQNDLVHIQWTGSDANPNGNDGQGRRMTDRSNLVEVNAENENIPKEMSEYTFLVDQNGEPDVALIEKLAYLEQNSSDYGACNPEENNQQALSNCKVMNNAPAYFNAGLVRVNAKLGVHHLMSTRNNNFSNRSQKSTIIVLAALVQLAVGSGNAADQDIIILAATFGTLGALGALFAVAYVSGMFSWALLACGLRRSDSKVINEDVENLEEGTSKRPKGVAHMCGEVAALPVDWWNRLSQHSQCLVVYFVMNLAFALEGFCFHVDAPHFPYLALAKAGGYMLDFNFTMILFPVMRNFMSFLRMTPLVKILPMDDHLAFHKFIGSFSLFAITLHVVMHYLVMQAKKEDGGSSIAYNALGTRSGFTGHVVIALMTIMYFTAWERVKQAFIRIGKWRIGGYNTFFLAHHLYVPVYALLLLHSESFHKWAFWPIVMLGIDKAIGSLRAGRKVHLLHASLEKADVMRIQMDIVGFRYKPGQYLYLNCPALSKHEWHPFTITSAPEEGFVSVHIRTRGDWTSRLKEHICPEIAEEEPLAKALSNPVATNSSLSEDTGLAGASVRIDRKTSIGEVFRVDGPYGTGSEHVFDYDVAVLIGAGIGVTPYASIVKSVRLRMNQATPELRKKLRPVRIYFYWVCRDMQEFNWFSPMLQDAQKAGEADGPRIDINTYMTGELNLDDLQQKQPNDKSWAGKKWAGRPNWRRVFKEIAENHPKTNVGVFLCGPGAKDIQMHCKQSSKSGETTFDFHKENF